MHRAALAAAFALLVAACGADDPVLSDAGAATAPAAAADSTSTTGPPAPATPTTAAPATTATTAAPTTTAPPTTAPRVRLVTEQAWVPMSVVGPVTIHHPSSRVEMVGYHESNHDGAQQQEPVATTVRGVTMETRDRGTGSRTAADVVVDPALEIRAPVTGTVLRAGTYTLYCDTSDDYVVIEPDARPGWEVKVLHIVDEQVSAGDRVVAGETVIAVAPHVLPFESQTDELRTADPFWPHVHIEVVDPSIPDRPSPGGGCR